MVGVRAFCRAMKCTDGEPCFCGNVNATGRFCDKCLVDSATLGMIEYTCTATDADSLDWCCTSGSGPSGTPPTATPTDAPPAAGSNDAPPPTSPTASPPAGGGSTCSRLCKLQAGSTSVMDCANDPLPCSCSGLAGSTITCDKCYTDTREHAAGAAPELLVAGWCAGLLRHACAASAVCPSA
jgi:hypothetical protein